MGSSESGSSYHDTAKVWAQGLAIMPVWSIILLSALGGAIAILWLWNWYFWREFMKGYKG
jgi:hypothetical protein